MRLHRYIGRVGFTLTAEKRGDAYGTIGAKSYVVSLAVWVNPKDVKRA